MTASTKSNDATAGLDLEPLLFGTDVEHLKPALLSEVRPVTEGDPEALAELDRLEARYQTAAARETEGVYEQAVVLLLVRLLRLYIARGLKTFEEYCLGTLGISRSSGIVLSDLAAAFTAEQFAALGPSKARLCLLLLRATPEDDSPDDLAHMRLRHGPNAGKLVVRATARDLEDEVRAERSLVAPARFSLPEDSSALVERLRLAVGDGVRILARRKQSKTSAGEQPAGELNAVRYSIEGLSHEETLVVEQALASFRAARR